jgi:UDP-N-acetyl-D-mannosaminuronic acid dehydrogenase
MSQSERPSCFRRDAVVVGGCGHAGLLLGIALASRDASVASYDTSKAAVAAVRAGQLPFHEPDAELARRAVLAAGRLTVTTDPAFIRGAEHVIIAIDGTVEDAFSACAGYLNDRQLLVLCSTVRPGDTARLEKLVADLGIDLDVAYCPERTAQGQAMSERFELPQIVASRTERGAERAARLFRLLTPAVVPMSPEEAELAKLFANAWRYISFAAANELYAIANDRGLDYERIRQGMMLDYPRAASLPAAGLTAGPCLRKDTIGLIEASAAFAIGEAAVAANDGLADYLVGRLTRRHDLAGMRVGILGMAYKGGSDDTRASLAYRLERMLAGRVRQVLCTDPLVTSDPRLVPLTDVLDLADMLIVAVPHQEYRNLHTDKPVADVWGVTGRGVRV